jgi:hypothetical protein
MKMIWSVLVGMAFCGALEAADAAMPMAKNPPKVSIEASRSRQTKIAGGDYDDRTQKVQLEITVKNLDLNKKSVSGLTLHYWTIGQSMVDKRVYVILERGSFPVSLDNTAQGRTLVHETENLTLKWDDTGAKFGEAYKGYLLVLVNDQNEVVAVKSNQPTWQSAFAKAFNLQKGARVGSNLDPASAR